MANPQTEKLEYTIQHSNWHGEQFKTRVFRELLELSRRLDEIEKQKAERQ